MNIVLVGYGQMGHMLRTQAEERGHKIVLTVDPIAKDADFASNDASKTAEKIASLNADAVIEFSHPSQVLANINAILKTHVPLVVGTTGWNDKIEEVTSATKEAGSHLFYAANYSIGMNLFYKIVSNAAKLFASNEEYDCALWEAHHIKKADSPSGTALDIAKNIMAQMPAKTEIVTDAFHEKPKPHQLHVSSTRVGAVPGTHTVYFDSASDTIELTHTVRSRACLALGAVKAAEWLVEGKKNNLASGVYTMSDILG